MKRRKKLSCTVNYGQNAIVFHLICLLTRYNKMMSAGYPKKSLSVCVSNSALSL